MRPGNVVFAKDWSKIQRNLNILFSHCNIKGYCTISNENDKELTVEFKVLPEAKEKCRVKLVKGTRGK